MIHYPKRTSWWVLCHDCGYEWVTDFMIEFGLLEAVDSSGTECPECKCNDVEATLEFVEPTLARLKALLEKRRAAQ